MIRRAMAAFKGNRLAYQLARGSFVSSGIQGAGAVLVFLSEVLLARILGAPEYGMYALVMAWLQVMVIVALLGSNQLLLRFVPVYLSMTDWPLLRGVLRQCVRITLLISATAVLIAAGILFALQDRMDSHVQTSFLVGFAVLPFAALSAQRQAILRGFHRVESALVPELIVRPSLLIALLLAFAWGMNASVSATTALGMNGLAFVVTFALGWYWQRRVIPAEANAVQPDTRTREWLRVALPLFLIAGLQLLIIRLDILMLGAIAGREQAGIYAAAGRIADVVVFALVSANAIVAPMIAGLYARKDIGGLQQVLTMLARGIVLFTIPLALAVVYFGRDILDMFGDGYRTAYVPLLILVCGQMVNALSGPVGFLLAMTGYQMDSLRILVLAMFLNLALNIGLIPLFGILGAAIATGVSTVLWNLLMLNKVRKRLGVDGSVFALLGRRI